jgi:hypothetical protein
MNPIVINQLRKYISESLYETSTNNCNIFDRFIEKCKYYYEQPAHSISEIKLKQNTKVKGDIFEHFCYLYFTYVKGWKTYFLTDIPQDLRNNLGLNGIDLGIDLIAVCPKGNKYCIQAKYRKFNQKKKTVLGWKTLSTFYALAQRTGP